ncbi:hypothetical protein JIG36_51010 [Actinoplanes sp. LDG1-06]|uniref:Uncharacterized protein n=1 Tax=Paractinoplanes ovalisporus TaxID=2810368 RepID=A0ABS2AVF9_9ACTN|nr:hypothetical protein [Actinoplanes ovalisporus]MBM2623850.1 hypothetical protein [Actinoplanes ovalisporus]
MSGFRKPSVKCPHNRARVAPVEPGRRWRIEIDGEPYTLDPDRTWARFATSDPADADYELTRTLGAIMLAHARQVLGDYGVTADEYIDEVREMYRAGKLVIERGRAYPGKPVLDAIGRVIGSRRLTDAEAAAEATRIDQSWRAATENDRGAA